MIKVLILQRQTTTIVTWPLFESRRRRCIPEQQGGRLRNGKSKDDSNTYFMFQLSLIGAEFGRQLRGFAELGVGDQGFAQAGIRYKF